MAKLLLLAFVCISGVSLAWSSSWNYIASSGSGPKDWTGVCKTGTKQSPIDINSKSATYKSYPFNLQYFGTTPAINFTGTNNGHTVQMTVPSFQYFVNGGGLPSSGNFTTGQFHLHWGANDSKGSEHLVDSKQYAAEMHFVNFNVKYPNLTYAADKSDGLAVLSVLIKVGSTNSAFNNIANHLVKLKNESSTVDGIAAFSLAALLPDTAKFYRYPGSLTTPGCYESVTWTVFSNPIQVSSSQMAALRNVMMNSTLKMEDNFRPVQALNSRTVYRSFNISDDSTTATPGIPTKPGEGAAVVAKVTTSLLLMMLFGALFLN